jgi:hypothetical protein
LFELRLISASPWYLADPSLQEEQFLAWFSSHLLWPMLLHAGVARALTKLTPKNRASSTRNQLRPVQRQSQAIHSPRLGSRLTLRPSLAPPRCTLQHNRIIRRRRITLSTLSHPHTPPSSIL